MRYDRFFCLPAVFFLALPLPVCCVASAAPVQRVESDRQVIFIDGEGDQAASQFTLHNGTALLNCKKSSVVLINEFQLQLAAGAVVLIKESNGIIMARNLSDRHAFSVHLTGKSFPRTNIRIGQEVAVGPAAIVARAHDSIGRRGIKSVSTKSKSSDGGLTMKVCDISVQDNLVNEPTVIYACRQSGSLPADRRLKEELIRTTAILNMMTRSQGPYYRGNIETGPRVVASQ